MIRTEYLVCAAALAALAPAPGSANTTQHAAAVDPKIAERAATLARLLNSEAIIIGDSETDEKALALVPQLFGSNADIAELEKQYPGISLELARAILPITNRSARERLPQLWDRQAALYASTFSAAELDQLIAFYESPTGRKMIAAMMAAMQPKHMISEAAKSPDMRFGASSALADIRAAVPSVLETMTAEDQAALARLAASGLAGKMQALAPQTQKIAIDWMNENAPWEEAETERVVGEVMAKRMGAEK